MRISLGKAIAEVSHADGLFTVRYGDEAAAAPALVIATGGPSIPKMGATGFAYDLARQFGLKVVEPRPALVPLTLGGEDRAVPRAVGRLRRSRRARRQDGVPRGGARSPIAAFPARRSCKSPPTGATARRSGSISCPDAAADWALAAKRARPKTHFHTLLGELLPGRLAEALAKKIGLWGELANLPDAKLREAARPARRLALPPERHRGLRQGRGHRRRDQHRRPLLADHGGAPRARPLRDRRGGRRHRLAGGL